MTVIPSRTARTLAMLEQTLAFPGMSFPQALIFRTVLTAFLLLKGVTLELTGREVTSPSTRKRGADEQLGRRREVREAGTLSSRAREMHTGCQEPSAAPQDATTPWWLSIPKG